MINFYKSYSIAWLLLVSLLVTQIIAGTGPSQEVKLAASNGGAYDAFGDAVSLSDSMALIGAKQDDLGRGSASIFRSSDAGVTWNQTAKMTLSNGVSGDSFGCAVSIYNTIVLIGASGVNSGRGSAFIFRSSNAGATWSQAATLTAADTAQDDSFGFSVSIFDNNALVGARDDDSSQGSAYIFRSSDGGATWSQNAKLTASDGASSARFGCSVSIHNGTALIGAMLSDSYKGSAYIFRSSDGGVTWNQTAKLTQSNRVSGDEFGSSVSIYSYTALIGTPRGDSLRGSAYIFQSNDGGVTWPTSETSKLTASDRGDSAAFGVSVSIFNHTILIGASLEDSTNRDSGSAYLFQSGDGGVTWPTSETSKLTVSGLKKNSNLGRAVSIFNAYALVGAPGYYPGGSAYLFSTRCGDGVLQTIERCDDGNFISGDGCSSSCGVERGWTCSGEPSICHTTCGDGIVAGIEKCDDGNGFDNDGCGNNCAVDVGWSCTGEPSICIKNAAPSTTAGEEGIPGLC